MHLLMIVVVLIVAWWLRTSWNPSSGDWVQRWQRSLFYFLFPPLLVLTTVLAVLCMGTRGTMGGMNAGSFGYLLALTALILVNLQGLRLAWQGWQSIKSARECPQINLDGQTVRLLPTPALFAGQMGFWQPELVVSQGLIESLSPAHLDSVLAHEQGHHHYRDTFWFFWLGWVRSCTAWLPQTEALWQELLMLRELRADSYAADRVDPLTLAESLLLVVSSKPVISGVCCAALGNNSDRLEQRIEALINPTAPINTTQLQSWHLFLLAFLPLITVIFHT